MEFIDSSDEESKNGFLLLALSERDRKLSVGLVKDLTYLLNSSKVIFCFFLLLLS